VFRWIGSSGFSLEGIHSGKNHHDDDVFKKTSWNTTCDMMGKKASFSSSLREDESSKQTSDSEFESEND
jgi:hypothetical protein